MSHGCSATNKCQATSCPTDVLKTQAIQNDVCSAVSSNMFNSWRSKWNCLPHSQLYIHTYVHGTHGSNANNNNSGSIKIQHAIVVVVAVAVVVEYDDEFKSDKTDRMKTEHSSLVINAKMPSAILRITHEENVVRANEHICFCCLQLLNTHSV